MRLSHRTQLTFAATALMVSTMLISGCECGSLVLPDASVPDASIDAAFAPDVQGFDTSRDVLFVFEEGIGDVPLAQPDVYEPVDAGFDCSTCRAALPCETLRCVTSCEYIPSANGTSCGGDDSVCVEASCVMRRCGDGWRENGSSTLPVEGCDDGNTTAGDGCDAMCVAEVFLANASSRRVTISSGNPAAGIDDAGNMLVAWAEVGVGADLGQHVMARRFDRHGVPIDAAPVMLDSGPSTVPPMPTVLGMLDGWVLSWSSTTIETPAEAFGIAYSRVPVSGAFPSARLANTGDTSFSQSKPSMARLDDGFVIAWSSAQVMRQNIAARLFASDGTPRAPLFHPRPVDAAPQEYSAFVVSRGGNDWTLAYAQDFDAPSHAIDYTGTSPSMPYAVAYAHGTDLVLGRGDTSTAFALVSPDATGYIYIRPLLDGMPPMDDAALLRFGDTRRDEGFGLASLGGPHWLAMWSRPTAPTPGPFYQVELSAGATRPRGLDRLIDALMREVRPEGFSIGRVSAELRDGWLVTFVGGGRNIYTMRLTPG